MPKNGQLITVEIDEEREQIAHSFFERSPHRGKITVVIGQALDVISPLEGPFEMVYIDADKVNYSRYYEAVMPLVPSGELIVADNVLWRGEVLIPDSEDSFALAQFAMV